MKVQNTRATPIKREPTEKSAFGRRFPPLKLTLYKKPPVEEEVTIDEFREFALLRLYVLRKIEAAKGKGSSAKEIDKVLSHALMSSLDEQAPKSEEQKSGQWGPRKSSTLNDRRVDGISHFILRLAYCQSESLRQQFLMAESEIFRYRFQNAAPHEQEQFFRENGFKFQTIADRNELPDWVRNKMNQAQESKVYLIPFEDATRLVARRQVYLEKGNMYCPESLLFEIIVGRFRARLAQQLAIAYRQVQNQAKDARVHPWLFQLVSEYLGPRVKAGMVGAITPQQIPELAKSSFPLCMRNSYDHLVKERHLKNSSRMQFGLFLKGIGLSLPDCLHFFRTHFNPRTPPNKFDKNYAYTFKHQHGAVGKRTSYDPFGCQKIISTVPLGGDHCGCPYKTYDETQLAIYLRKTGIPESGVREIVDLKKGDHYQIACQRLFQLTHPKAEMKEVGNHPNQYFRESYDYHYGKNDTSNQQQHNSSQVQSHDAKREVVIHSKSSSSSSGSGGGGGMLSAFTK